MYPEPELSYCRNFLHMMFSKPLRSLRSAPEVVEALNQFLILHADHEQNCSTSTVRMVGSVRRQCLRLGVGRGLRALGAAARRSQHGGDRDAREDPPGRRRARGSIVEKVKNQQVPAHGLRPPRLQELRSAGQDPRSRRPRSFWPSWGHDPLLEIAEELGADALLPTTTSLSASSTRTSTFTRGIILRAIGIPLNMFTVMFSIGRMPGWIAHWYELYREPARRIGRPRQVYTGPTKRPYVAIEERGASSK